MKRHHLLAVSLVLVLGIASVASAQHVKVFDGNSYEPAAENNGFDTITMQFIGRESPNIRFFIASVAADTREECLASRPLSAFLPVGPATASSSYDAFTNTTTHTWHLRNLRGSRRPVCEVLMASSDGIVDSADYNIWRSNFGTGGRPAPGSSESNRRAAAEPYLKFKLEDTLVSGRNTGSPE